MCKTSASRKVEVKDFKLRLLQSCGFFACFFLIGLMFGIIGPTLIDLAIQTRTNIMMTSLILPFRAAGYVVSVMKATCSLLPIFRICIVFEIFGGGGDDDDNGPFYLATFINLQMVHLMVSFILLLLFPFRLGHSVVLSFMIV